jgi:hypothetical protein
MSPIISHRHATLVRKTLFGRKKGPQAQTIGVGDGVVKFQCGPGEVCIIALSTGANLGKFSYRYDTVLPFEVLDKFLLFLEEKNCLPHQRKSGIHIKRGSDRDMVWDEDAQAWK